MLIMKRGSAKRVGKRSSRISTAMRGSVPGSAQVLAVEKIGREDVYDLSVLRHHNFSINGGLIVHNCMDSARYLCYTLTTRSRLDAIRDYY